MAEFLRLEQVHRRITTAQLVHDLGVEIVLLVPGLPIPERYSHGVQQSAVDVAATLGERREFVFRNEDEVVQASAPFQQILERLANNALPMGAGNPAQVLQSIQVLPNGRPTHGAPSGAINLSFGKYSR